MGSAVSRKKSTRIMDLESTVNMLQIPWKEDWYPPPAPPNTRSKEVFILEDYADIDQRARNLQIPWKEDWYPPPAPPNTRSKEVFILEDYADIDQRARNIKIEKTTTFDVLLHKLTHHCTNDLQKVRSIFTWIGSQQNAIQNGKFKKLKTSTGPMSFMKLIQENKGSYSEFFAVLCRQVGIPCVIIYGISKSFDYEVGDRDVLHLRNCWNAVYVERQWRLIHPLWAFCKMKHYNVGYWKVKYTDSRLADEQCDGFTVGTVDDFFFLVEPSVFIYMCLPAAYLTDWQLLSESWSMEKFINAPMLKKPYFLLGLSLESEQSCVLDTRDGCVVVVFTVREDQELNFTQELLYDNKASLGDMPKDTVLENYCLICRKHDKISFHVRCPVSGIFKLRVYGGLTVFHNISDFRIVCDEGSRKTNPYPLIKAMTFGFTDNSKTMGLSVPSEYGGIIKLQPGQGKLLSFETTLGVEVQAVIYHLDKSQEETKRYVATKVREMCFDVKKVYVNVYLNLPASDQMNEYALHIFTKRQGNEDFENAVNYMLVMDKLPVDSSRRTQNRSQLLHALEDLKAADRRSIRSIGELSKAISSAETRSIGKLSKAISSAETRSIGELSKAISSAETLHLDNADIVNEAKTNMSVIKLKRDLQLAIDRRNETFLKNVIAQSHPFEHDPELSDLIVVATTVLNQLHRLRLFLLDVLQITQPTISEIHNYTRPKAVVHDIMKAVYLLLGEDEKNLSIWEYVQFLMREVGTNSLLNRLKLFDVIDVDETKMEQAHQLLDNYDADIAREASTGAAIFYNWIQNIIVEMAVSDHSKITSGRDSYTDSETTSRQVSESSYKRRIRKQLCKLMDGDDIEELERVTTLFEKHRLQDNGDHTNAVERIECLKLKRDLRQAVLRRNIGVLVQVIARATGSRYAHELNSQIEAAQKLKQELMGVNESFSDLGEMEQKTIAELRRYSRPPSCVCDVLKATYMLLGENEECLKVWTVIQRLLGRQGGDSIIQQVAGFDPTRVGENLARRVKDILDRHNPSDIRAASNGAAVMYLWTRSMVEHILMNTSVKTLDNERMGKSDCFSCLTPTHSNR